MWQDYVTSIKEDGRYTNSGIANEIKQMTDGAIDVHESTIGRLQKNKHEPSYSLGVAIIKLYEKVQRAKAAWFY